MRRRLILVLVVAALLVVVVAAVPAGAAPKCVTIQSGLLKYAAGHYLASESLATGYDAFGYNYQAHMFNGSYFNAYAGGAGFPPYEGDSEAYLAANPSAAKHWAWPYRDDNVMMKWNDAWLSNQDCNSDGKLDRHFGYLTYRGSGAWETNHQSGEYVDDGVTYKWNDFVKIVAVPADATLDTGSFLPGYPAALGYDGTWRTVDGTDIGPGIWGEFAIIQEVYQDTGTGDHGLLYKSPFGPGFGHFAP